jgi:DNA replicative helicase MCM subunit Mcm2 (Cdc46/Mcm family)
MINTISAARQLVDVIGLAEVHTKAKLNDVVEMSM